MVLGDPVFNLAVKLGRLRQDLFRFGLRGDIGEGVVNCISLAPTGFKLVGVPVGAIPQQELGAFE
jgi:hypothetical protein